MPTIEEIVLGIVPDHPYAGELALALVAREEEIKNRLLIVATSLGTDVALAIKVLNDLGFGAPVDDDAKALIDAQFQVHLDHYREHFGPEFGAGLS